VDDGIFLAVAVDAARAKDDDEDEDAGEHTLQARRWGVVEDCPEGAAEYRETAFAATRRNLADFDLMARKV